MAEFKLSQTVAGSWVITMPNPEEKGWETQLAEFDTTVAAPGTVAAIALEDAAAAAMAAIIVGMISDDRVNLIERMAMEPIYAVTSHNEAAASKMGQRVAQHIARMTERH